MSDILIARLKFPNDPTGNVDAHQMFIAELNSDYIDIYSISKILGKESRVFYADGSVKKQYFTITGIDQINNGFKLASFIDCSKIYKIKIDDCMDLSQLSLRAIDSNLVLRIKEKIAQNGISQTVYNISSADFILWNPICVNVK